jgi:hypothetical protein
VIEFEFKVRDKERPTRGKRRKFSILRSAIATKRMKTAWRAKSDGVFGSMTTFSSSKSVGGVSLRLNWPKGSGGIGGGEDGNP